VSSNKIIGVLISSFIFTILSIVVIQTKWPIIDTATSGPSTVELIGKLILGKYLLPFELISILLLAALVGAALLARKKTITDKIEIIDDKDEDVENNDDQVKSDNSNETELKDEEDIDG